MTSPTRPPNRPGPGGPGRFDPPFVLPRLRQGRTIAAATKRSRRRLLAARDGLHCAYCRTPFSDPQQATLDHVIPRSLLPTWDPAFLVLSCEPCNAAKADQMPILLALLLAHLAPALLADADGEQEVSP